MNARCSRWGIYLKTLAMVVAVWYLPVHGQGFDPGGEFPNFGDIEFSMNGNPFEFEGGFQEAPRCLVHEMSAPGQGWYLSGSGWYLSGSARGLVPGDQITVVDSGGNYVTTETSYSPGSFLSVQSATQSMLTYWDLLAFGVPDDGTVAIIVADDFGGGPFELPLELWALGASQDPLDDLENLVDTGTLTHGSLVLAHLVRLVDETGLFERETDSDVLYSWTSNRNPDSKLVIVPVDLSTNDQLSTPHRIESSEIAAALRAVYERNGRLLQPVSGKLSFVVNMSWVLLPCATVEDFIQAGGTGLTFQQYLEALTTSVDLPPSAPLENLMQKLSILSWVPPNDPLHEFLSSFLSDSPEVPRNPGGDVFVAAAGNFSMDYQMVPAALPSVIGVGTPIYGQPSPEFSNAADVSAPGAWFNIDGIVSYAGTSYSAPFVSLFMAIDLAGRRTCLPEWLGGSGPGLGLDKSPGYPQPRTLIGDAASTCGYP